MSAASESPRRAPGRRPLPTWNVAIGEHDIPPRWRIPAQTRTVGAVSAAAACAMVVRSAHRDAVAPPLLSMIALSLGHARAERAGRFDDAAE